MLLDIGSVLGGAGLAVLAFVVVIAVCVIILRLLAVILPPYQGPYAEPAEGDGAATAVEPADAANASAADEPAEEPEVEKSPATDPTAAEPARDPEG